MKYEYKLLNDGQGVILTRQPIELNGDLAVNFFGAPPGAVALFKAGEGSKCYRELKGGACIVPCSLLKGTVDVSVVCYDETIRPRSWTCERLVATTLEHGSTIIAPDDNYLPSEVTGLKIADHQLREDFKRLEEKFNNLSEKFTSIMEGYDLT